MKSRANVHLQVTNGQGLYKYQNNGYRIQMQNSGEAFISVGSPLLL